MNMLSCLTLKTTSRWTCWALVITAVGCGGPAITSEGNLSADDPSTTVGSLPADAPNSPPQPKRVNAKATEGVKFIAQVEQTIADHPQLQEIEAVGARFDQVLSQMREEGAEEANALIFVELRQIESAAQHLEVHEGKLRQSLAYQAMDEPQREKLKGLDADLYRQLQETAEEITQAEQQSEAFRERAHGLVDRSAYMEIAAKILGGERPEGEKEKLEAALEYHSEMAKLKSSSQIQGFEDSMAKKLELGEEYGVWLGSQNQGEMQLAILREIWDRITADERREIAALWPEYMLEVAEAGREAYKNRNAPPKPLPSFMVIKTPTAAEIGRLIVAEVAAREHSNKMQLARAYSAATGGNPNYNQIKSEVWMESRATQAVDLQIKFHGAELIPALESVAKYPNAQIAGRANELLRTLKQNVDP